MSNLDLAICIAVKVHAGQKDKAGQPYILHPLRVMFAFRSERERIVAVLHDAMEDGDYSLEDLRNDNFPEDIIEAIDCLTKRENESYEEFIVRVSKNRLASRIKIADLRDNLDLTRLEWLEDKDLDRVSKYHSALNILLKAARVGL